MKRIAFRIYVGLLLLWLLACGLRALLPQWGNYHNCSTLRELEPPCFCTDCSGLSAYYHLHGVPLAEYAELSKRLEQAQPGTRFFCGPGNIVLLTPQDEAAPELTPSAQAELVAWIHEVTISVPKQHTTTTMSSTPSANLGLPRSSHSSCVKPTSVAKVPMSPMRILHRR